MEDLDIRCNYFKEELFGVTFETTPMLYALGYLKDSYAPCDNIKCPHIKKYGQFQICNQHNSLKQRLKGIPSPYPIQIKQRPQLELPQPQIHKEEEPHVHFIAL